MNFRDQKIFFTTIVAILSYIGLFLLVRHIYNPDLTALIEKATVLHSGLTPNPEPREMFLFQLGVIFLPIICLLTYFFFNVKNQTYLPKINTNFLGFSACLGIMIWVYMAFSAPNPNLIEEGGAVQNARDTAATNFNFYFSGFNFENMLWAYFLLVVPACCAVYLFFRTKTLWTPLKWVKNSAIILFSLFLLLIIWDIFQFSFPFTWESQYDLSPLYYPQVNVFLGKAMLVDHFTCNYGLSAHFLNPVFKLIGLDVGMYSSVMASLIVFCYACLFATLWCVIKDKFLAVLSWLGVMFFCHISSKLVVAFDPYFALFPVRILVPLFTLFAATFYLRFRKIWMYYATFVLLGFGILWNPEFGMVSMLAWFIMLCYLEFTHTHTHFRWKAILQRCAWHGIILVVSITICFSIFALFIKFNYGSYPNFAELFASMKYFGSLGFMSLPMDIIHPWNLILLVYLIGFVKVVASLFEKNVNVRNAFILITVLMGVGIFTYFIGRSHNWNLSAVCFPAFILLGIFADELREQLNQKKINYVTLGFFYLTLSTLLIAPITLLGQKQRLTELKNLSKEKIANLEERTKIESHIDFMQGHEAELTDEILILSSVKFQDLYLGSLVRPSAFSPSLIDMFLQSDVERLKADILSREHDVFFENLYYGQYRECCAALCRTYYIDTNINDFYLLKPRSDFEPYTPVLNTVSNAVSYHHYPLDSSGWSKAAFDAVHYDSLPNLASNFNIEVVFKPKPQFYDGGTIFTFNCSNYELSLFYSKSNNRFLVKNDSLYFYFPEIANNTWCYGVFQISGNRLTLMVNGMPYYSLTIPEFDRASAKILIGNSKLENSFMFTGDITEVLVCNELQHKEAFANIYKKITQPKTKQ